MRKIFLILYILFTIIWLGPVSFGLFSDIKNGKGIDSGDIFFLIFGIIFMVIVFNHSISSKKRTIIEKNSTLSKKERESLKKYGNRIEAIFSHVDFDVVETTDPRACYIVLLEKAFGREFKQIIILNKNITPISLQEKKFPVYIDPKNRDRYFIDFSSLLNGNADDIFFLPIA